MKKLLKYPQTLLFALSLGLLFLLDLTMPEETFSDIENRELAQAPRLTVESLAANKYTIDYEEYVNDHFVFRSQWISIKSRCESLLGKLENNGVIYGRDQYQFVKQETINAEQYRSNTNAIATFAARHPGLVTVYVAPSASTVLVERLPAGAPFADENAALDEIANALEGTTRFIDLRAVLTPHQDEYIFYRTDHHWTTYGAYLAYAAFAQEKGFSPFDITSAAAVDVTDFYGTTYSKSKLYSTLPDVLTYYEIPGAALELNGETFPLYDYEKLETRDKYAAFLQGNNSFSTLTGGSGTGRCLLIKDSYGNCFAPFLLNNYAQVDVVDLRFFLQNMDNLVAEREYEDVIILYNFSSYQSDKNLVKLNLNL